MRRLSRGTPGALVIALIFWVGGPWLLARADTAREQRLDALQDEMKRVQGEMAGLALRERGLLGDVARMDAEIALRRAELEDDNGNPRIRIRPEVIWSWGINTGQEKRFASIERRTVV